MTPFTSPDFRLIFTPRTRQIPGRILCGPQLFLIALLTLLLITGATTVAHAQIPSDPTAEQPAEPPVDPGSTIATAQDELIPDEAISQRLRAILDNIATLKVIDVSVQEGVVLLTGEVDSSEQVEQAEQLAKRTEGVVLVLNQLSVNRSVSRRLERSWHVLADEFRGLLSYSPLLLVALLLIAGSVVVARYLSSRTRLINRLSGNWFVRDLWRQAIHFLVIAAGVIAALSLLDATALLGSLVGALGIIGLAIGFATRDTVENYIASILLSLRQPFSRDDAVLINDVEGKVLRLTPRATVLMSFDGNHIRIPNATVFKATIVNYSRNPLRRFEFQVGVDTDLELTGPRSVALHTLAAVPGVLPSPAPVCLVQQLGDSSVIFTMQAWIDQRHTDFLKARSEAQRLVKEAFDEADIVMPEPIYNVNLRRGRKPGSVDRTSTDASAGQATTPVDTEQADTAADETVEEQMRAERAASSGEDLLSETAPQE